MGFSLRFSKDSTLPKPHSVLMGHTNPLCYGLPPHHLLPYGTTQPTSASMVPQRSLQCKVKKEDPLLSVESNAIVPFPQSWPTFSQIAISVTEHPLPPAMREFKTNQTSTVHPASSSLHPFLWRWKISFHQFNIQFRPSFPLQPIIP
ncbi:hypothetical protein AVEN_181128-1 [Araneus ventricosus]|uniref:Uncharacterized protein n=1 Tax=Araneus ventricosus TaxID=182803 RepID=A0A4Y2HL04_ARAVE|nr:hypothetical protein AVEN_181128-1 [Araneus ventricosus]